MSLSTRILAGTGALVMAAGAMVFAQSTDVSKVMADMRKALGGEQKLAAIKSLSATGKSQRATGETSMGGDYEMMLELPDKYFTRQIVAQTPIGPVGMKAGFNGDGLIQEAEQPPQAAGMRMTMISSGGTGPNATPEARAAAAKRQIANSREELARMALGMFGASVGGYALEYSYGGTAESPDGKADIVNVKGPGDFAGKLFVDQKSHLPLMFSWMAKEPLVMNTSMGRPGGPGAAQGGGNVQTFTMGGNGSGKPPTQEEQAKMMADLEARRQAAEANLKMVEYRMFYSDYQAVDGVQLPHHFQQAIAGNPSTEITIEKYKVNPKIDPKKFETVK